MDLYKLTKLILSTEENGVSKVRLAKTIYFVHKHLIRQRIASPKDIEYIRMPLGPVPTGFMELSDLHPDILVQIEPSGLLYNSSIYSLRKPRWWSAKVNNKDDGFEVIKRLIGDLDKLPTSVLVEVSHNDPSWKSKENGEHFYIHDTDLDNELPSDRDIAYRSDTADAQCLQASLINGMLKDIVEESTELEFPTDES